MQRAIGRALARARERAGLSQDAAAEAVGLDPVVLSYYETGRLQPPLGAVLALARFYGISVRELLEEGREEDGRSVCRRRPASGRPP